MIVWNEPNLSQEWGYRPARPRRLHRTAASGSYAAIKAANPEVQVLGGALAPTLAPPGNEWAMNDLDYLQGMYDAGAAGAFDILAAHAYGWTFAADEPPARTRSTSAASSCCATSWCATATPPST